MSPESNLLFDDKKFQALNQIAEIMASGVSTVPTHLRGNKGDCFAIAMQSAQWGMNPFAVAQKTHVVNGTLGYEAQLVNAVINTMAPTTDRMHYQWFGPWERVIGKFKTLTSQKGNSYQAPAWTPEDEKDCGVKVWATLKGEDKPRELDLLLSQATVRNSTLWAADPKQQLSYLAVKKWSRLHCPEVILGVYSPDELEEEPRMKNVTPPKPEGGSKSEKLLNKLKGKEQDVEEQAEVKQAEVVEDKRPSIRQILEAEIERTGAPIMVKDIDRYMKKEKAAGPSIEAICAKIENWDTYVRNNAVAFVKTVAEWSINQ
ncbi:MAG: recombinase RecT [Victivallales bacterium]|nr:recombinase RecT [Victivallales bacterium]